MQLTSYIKDKYSIKTLINSGFTKLLVEEPHFSLLSRRYYGSSPNYTHIASLLEKVKSIKANVKLVFNLDIIPHNKDLNKIEKLVQLISKLGFDGIRVQDMGLITFIQDINPNINIELNSITGNYNYEAILALEKHCTSLKTIVYSKEIGYKDLKQINRLSKLNNELLVHGPMLLFYTKRQLVKENKLLKTLVEKDNISLYLQEKKRVGQYFPLINNKHGSFLLLPQTLCLIEHLGLLDGMGLNSILFDFRNIDNNKTITNIMDIYKEKLDGYNKENALYSRIKGYYRQGLTEGFFLYAKEHNNNISKNANYGDKEKVATVISTVKDRAIAVETFLEVSLNDEFEIITPENKSLSYKVTKINSIQGDALTKASKNKLVILNWRKGTITKSILYKKQ